MQQFDFAQNWRKKIKPLLDKPAVERALTTGMLLQGDNYKPGDPPWLHGRGQPDGKRPRQGSLSWYQPFGCCHYIAPFSWALGRELYPDLEWGFITSDAHTVAIGYVENWSQPDWVMDILAFRQKTAQESLDFARSHGWKFYRSLSRFAASFYFDPEYAHEVFQRLQV